MSSRYSLPPWRMAPRASATSPPRLTLEGIMKNGSRATSATSTMRRTRTASVGLTSSTTPIPGRASLPPPRSWDRSWSVRCPWRECPSSSGDATSDTAVASTAKRLSPASRSRHSRRPVSKAATAPNLAAPPRSR
jgi:hypothetical protein